MGNVVQSRVVKLLIQSKYLREYAILDAACVIEGCLNGSPNEQVIKCGCVIRV